MMHGPIDRSKYTIVGNPVAITPAPRAYPHNIEAEQALLGAILINNEALDRIGERLAVDHFYEPLHGRIFVAI